mmetsp:Transcript_22781/g.48411  ORF Transcript_22781/g.48411 Transcript_22781/m.48411 type:complete len:86 (+) Transcript_22781:2619-2876(+)
MDSAEGSEASNHQDESPELTSRRRHDEPPPIEAPVQPAAADLMVPSNNEENSKTLWDKEPRDEKLETRCHRDAIRETVPQLGEQA